ncbi:carboxypeptidase-like regulatory domain-containing protein [Psychroserpens sp. BH13MA-6]
MKKNKDIFILLAAFCLVLAVPAQTINLKGKITANADVGHIHVLNISAKEYTVSDDQGQFEIPVNVKDTLLISSVQYIPQHIQITKEILDSKTLNVVLEDRVNELDEVVVGKVLTGNLLIDVENSDAQRDINFYDLGIPGYTGKPKTQKERRLYEADAGKSIVIAPLFIGINIHKILNKISGRTKKLKSHVKLEAQITCMNQMTSEFKSLLFADESITDAMIADFFYYAAEDPKFTELCSDYNSFEVYKFLVSKLQAIDDDNSQSKD